MTYSNDRPVVFLSCAVFQHLLEKIIPKEIGAQISYLDYGLHEVPKNLRSTVQEMIDDLSKPSLVVLGYGLCGNGLNGIRSGKHTLLIPRADDCIAILLGSYQAYLTEFHSNPGTYYLSKGWLESGTDPLTEYEKMIEKYGHETGEWIMDQQYQHYKRLVLVAHTQEDLEKYRPRALEVARYCERWGMEYEELLGSDGYVRGLIEAITGLTESNDEFLIIPSGEEIQQSQFMRLPE